MANKPWSSGRILTPSQRERKRMKDRALKRGKRILYHQRTNEMEARLQRLEILNATYFERTHEIKPQSDVTDSSCLPCTAGEHWSSSLVENSDLNGKRWRDNSIESVLHKHGRGDFNQDLFWGHSVYDSTPAPTQRSDTVHPSYYMSQLQNNTLGLVHSLTASQVCTDDTVNQDALIRGVNDGWHMLQYLYDLCPLWGFLRKIDEGIFSQASLISRLSLLRGAHMLLLALVDPETIVNLAPWYQPRPSQLCFAHEIVADYFPWPGFRERLILQGYPKLTDDFWIEYTKSYRLLWSSDSLAYSFDRTINKYQFSRKFLDTIMDINNHTMNDKFFNEFPETVIDIKNMRLT